MRASFVYATDENYVGLTSVSILSLLKNNRGARVVVLTNGISSESEKRLKALAEKHGGEMNLLDVSPQIERIKASKANGYTSFAIYSRYLAPGLLKGRVDRIVYLDSDTLIVDSLDELRTLDLNGRPFAVGYDCLCNKYKSIIGLPPSSPYFNTGVLLIDIERWLATNCSERFFACLRERSGMPTILPDQDVLAFSLAEDAAVLPPQYNFLTHYQIFRRARDIRYVMDTPDCCWYDDGTFLQAQAKPAIHHFLGHTLGRPWYRESKNPLRELYADTATEAGVPEVAQQSRPLDPGYRVQWLCWKLLPRPLFLLACRTMYRYFFKSRYGV